MVIIIDAAFVKPQSLEYLDWNANKPVETGFISASGKNVRANKNSFQDHRPTTSATVKNPGQDSGKIIL